MLEGLFAWLKSTFKGPTPANGSSKAPSKPNRQPSRQQNRRQGPKHRDDQKTAYLDLLIIHDATASQSPYIQASVKSCQEICQSIHDSGKLNPKDGLRLGLIAFRDHNDEEEFCVRAYNDLTFTTDISKVEADLALLEADGGGDGPEAVTAALATALEFKWNPSAAKVVVLVTDAPPHGIGEAYDDYDDGDPNGKDPLFLAREMKKQGISLVIVACEPTLSNMYTYTHDFYMALAQTTQGLMIPLIDTSVLAPLIIGCALEHITLDNIVREYEGFFRKSIAEGKSLKEINEGLFGALSTRGQQIVTPNITDDIYEQPPLSGKYIEAWLTSENISAARKALKELGATRYRRVTAAYANASVTLKNLSDEYINYEYEDPAGEGQLKQGILRPNMVLPTKEFYVNTNYYFELKCGGRTEKVPRIFSRDGDWSLERYFL